MSALQDWKNDPNAAPVVNALKGYGYNDAAITGVMANLYREGVHSGTGYLNPETYVWDVYDYGGGIAGWLGDRHRDLQSWSANNGYSDWTDINAQAGYLVHDITANHPGLNELLLNVSNDTNGASAAASAFTLQFERPANMHENAAIRANDAANAFGTFSGTAGAGGNNSATGAGKGGSEVPPGMEGMQSKSPTRPVQTVTSGTRGLSGLSAGKDPYLANMISALQNAEEIRRDTGACSLINLRNNKSFQFYLNENVSVQYPVSYTSPGTVIGRSVPVTGYESTGAKSVTINLALYAGLMYGPEADVNNDPCGKLYKDLDFLTSLEYPDYSTALVIPPPVVLLNVNEIVKVRGVFKDLKIDHHRPLDSQGRAMHVDVSFAVVQVSENPPSDQDILCRTTRSF